MDVTDRQSSKASVLLHGLPGHPLHPPLTDATIGMFVLAAALAVLGALGAIEDAAGKACWLALIGGLVVAGPAAGTRVAGLGRVGWGTARWRTATLHLTAMATAVVLFAVAAWLQHRGYQRGEVTAGGLVFSVVGLVALTAGGWLGGAIVFVHGVRVVAAPDTPSRPAENGATDGGAAVSSTTKSTSLR